MNKKYLIYVTMLSLYSLVSYADKPVYVSGNFNGHGYELIPAPTPWYIAKKKADDAGGYLVVITSQEENDFITKLLSKATKGEYCETWIGLTDEKNEGDYKWINGEKLSYTKWCKNNPDNSDGSENAVQLLMNGDGLYWNDRSSGRRCAYIIEYNHEIDLNNEIQLSGVKSSLRSTR